MKHITILWLDTIQQASEPVSLSDADLPDLERAQPSLSIGVLQVAMGTCAWFIFGLIAIAMGA